MVFRFFREIYCRIINHHSPHEVHFSNRQNEDGSCDGWANLVKCVMCKKVLLNQPDFIENNKNPLAQIYGVHGSSGSCTVNVEIIDGDTKIVNVYGGAYGGGGVGHTQGTGGGVAFPGGFSWLECKLCDEKFTFHVGEKIIIPDHTCFEGKPYKVIDMI